MNHRSIILDISPLGFQWKTLDPFLFCVHHNDHYPAGNAQGGPDVSLVGRNIGYDFTPKDGWRMYHGRNVPGFPMHPHRGFETVTIVRKGFVDHSDSLGAAGRYGMGDVQWMTAGRGVQHAEIFPLLNRGADNTLELFQIWMNLPAARKFCEPDYKMLWSEDIPCVADAGSNGDTVRIDVIAGNYRNTVPVEPPLNSWAADPMNEVAIWLVTMPAGSKWTLPAAAEGLNRTLYYFEGDGLMVGSETIPGYHSVILRSDVDIHVSANAAEARMLLLQGRPIAEAVYQYGPFVMSSRQEIDQAYYDYQETRFGGWPWNSPEPVHDMTLGRFAKYPDGRSERREG